MGVFIFTAIFVVCVIIYVFYSSYYLQFFLRKRKLKVGFIKEIERTVKGDFMDKGYFAMSHRIIKPEEFRSFSTKHRLPFSMCYNIITFRTADANFEFFFYMVKEGVRFSEIMNLRVFPKHNLIKSEGNVEKNYSRLNVFTNNRYLTAILETHDVNDNLKVLLKNNGDILLISHNNLHYKTFMSSQELTIEKLMDIIKSINHVKNKIYKDDVLEY